MTEPPSPSQARTPGPGSVSLPVPPAGGTGTPAADADPGPRDRHNPPGGTGTDNGSGDADDGSRGSEFPPGTLNPPAGPAVPHDSQGSDADREDLIRELAARYSRRLYDYAFYRCGRDRGRAEDLVQETLARAWRGWHDNGPAGGKTKVKPWLIAILRNCIIDTQRHDWSRPHEAGPGPLDRIATGSGENQILTAVIVREALDDLKPDHRDVLIETYFKGKSVAEAAAALGIKPGTVKSRTHYALKNLRQCLQDRGITSL